MEWYSKAIAHKKQVNKVKNPEAFNNMNSRHEEKPKQASGYQTQRG